MTVDGPGGRWFGSGGARLAESPPPGQEYHRTEDLGPRLDGVHWFDTAHTVMLTEEGLIPRAAGVAILRELRAMERAGMVEIRTAAGGGLHSAEKHLSAELGEETAGWLHLGRSSGDLGVVSVRVALRDRLLTVLSRLAAVREAVISVGRRELDTVMPGYTHGQQAQPTTLAHWLAMWGCVLERDAARLGALLHRVDVSPAGAGALTGTDFPLNRARTAELLGFTAVAPNTLDAVHSHDVELEGLSALAILGANLARLAEDILKWSADEFGMLELADRFCVTSSILPHKKNPLAPQRIKGAAAVAVGALASGFYVNKEPTAEAILDQGTGVQPALWRTLDLLAAGLDELPDMLRTMTVHRQRMAELAAGSWGQAVDIAGMLVRECAVPWRTAHQISATLVRRCVAVGVSPRRVTPEMVADAAREYNGRPLAVSADALTAALDPRVSVARRTLPGGPARPATTATLDALAETVAGDIARVAAVTERVQRARDQVRAAADALIAC